MEEKRVGVGRAAPLPNGSALLESGGVGGETRTSRILRWSEKTVSMRYSSIPRENKSKKS